MFEHCETQVYTNVKYSGIRSGMSGMVKQAVDMIISSFLSKQTKNFKKKVHAAPFSHAGADDKPGIFVIWPKLTLA
jgi:hypothetical protein